jgi:hypothetical protein
LGCPAFGNDITNIDSTTHRPFNDLGAICEQSRGFTHTASRACYDDDRRLLTGMVNDTTATQTIRPSFWIGQRIGEAKNPGLRAKFDSKYP